MGRIDCKNARTCGHNMCFEKACRNYAPYERTKPTNAERIRAMTDEELAYWIMCPYDSPFCDGIEHNCIECTKEWLQQPAEGD